MAFEQRKTKGCVSGEWYWYDWMLPKATKFSSSANEEGWSFTSCIHPSAIIGANVNLSNGIQVMAGVVIQSGSSLGKGQ